MDRFAAHASIEVLLRRSNVDTNQIVPAVYLKHTARTGLENALFAAWRNDPNFILDQDVYRSGSVLIAGPDFGTGSSHEHAVQALEDYDFCVVLSPKFADISRDNAGKQGFVTGVIIQENGDSLWKVLENEPGTEVTVSLEAKTVAVGPVTASFEIDDYTRWCLLEGLDSIALTLRDEDAICAYEARHPDFKPTTLPAKYLPKEEAISARPVNLGVPSLHISGGRGGSCGGRLCIQAESSRKQRKDLLLGQTQVKDEGEGPEQAHMWGSGRSEVNTRSALCPRVVHNSKGQIEETMIIPSVLHVEGGYPLQGTITIRGVKNSVPKAMVMALLSDGLSQLSNVPLIHGVGVVSDLLRLHDIEVNFDQTSGVITFDPRNMKIALHSDIDPFGGVSRIPILFYGPLLHQLGEAFIPELGGCNTGGRPVDFHLDTLRRFGAVVGKHPDGVHIRRLTEGLHGALIELPFPSVGAAEQTLLTTVRVEGITILKGTAVGPGIMDLINVLQKMGTIILVDIDRTIRIEEVSTLHGYRHNTLPDRVETASWGAAALATHGDIYVRGAHQPDMTTFLNTCRKVGGAFDIDSEGIHFYYPDGEFNSIALETAVHPGFMTNWQQLLVATLTQTRSLSIVRETMYENRFSFTKTLRKMDANIQVYREYLGGTPCRFEQCNFFHSTVISGPTSLHAVDITVSNLRGGFSHLIATLAAEGTSTVSGINIISQGCEHFTTKLKQLNARVGYLDA